MKKHFGDITEELKNKTSSEKIYLTLGLHFECKKSNKKIVKEMFACIMREKLY